MADFTVRSDQIDVEHIMRQIRARIRDKRGADYTEAEIRELASVKLDKFLDPRAVRSDLLQHYRRERQPAPLITADEAHPPLYDFNHETVYVSARGLAGRVLTIIRKLLKPVTKLFFHVDSIWDVLTKQSRMNAQHTALFQRIHQRFVTRDELDALHFEMFNNLVVELTRLGIEVKNLRMQVESFGTRLDFNERRARALEGVVQYRPGAPVARPQQPPSEDGDEDDALETSETRSARRRRRRRGRRRGSGFGEEGDGQREPASRDQTPRDQAPTQPTAQTSNAEALPASQTSSAQPPASEPAPREPAPTEASAPAPPTADRQAADSVAPAGPDADRTEPERPASDRPVPTRVFDSPRSSESGDPESSAS
jgi:hypothetical protein